MVRSELVSHPKHAADAMLAALHADGPHPDHAAELSLFGQFVGSWAIDNTYFHESGQERHEAEWRFGWSLDGRAVQDVLFHPSASKTGATRAYSEGIGTACAGAPTGKTSRSSARAAAATACAGASSRSRTTRSTGTASSGHATAATGGSSRRCSQRESPGPRPGPARSRASGPRTTGRAAGPRRTSGARRAPSPRPAPPRRTAAASCRFGQQPPSA